MYVFGMDLLVLVKDLGFEEKFISASDVVALLQEFSARSHIPV